MKSYKRREGEFRELGIRDEIEENERYERFEIGD